MEFHMLHGKCAILALVATLLPLGGAWGQCRNSSPDFHLKKHYFGFGVSTALFDNEPLINPYLITINNSAYTMTTHRSSFYAFYLDYQYRFNSKWSIETRLKYKVRGVFRHVYHPNGNNIGTVGIAATYHDIAIPVTINRRWASKTGSSLELLFGAGLTTLGVVRDEAETFGIASIPHSTMIKGHRFDRSLDPYGILGLQLEVPLGAIALKPFLSYSYSPLGNGRYYIIPQTSANPNLKESKSSETHLSELECGIIMQF